MRLRSLHWVEAGSHRCNGLAGDRDEQDATWYELKDLHSDHSISILTVVIVASQCALSPRQYARQMDLRRSTYGMYDISKDVV
jgi:hypothetical protein